MQILTTGTAPQDASGFNVYISNGVATAVTNGASISLTNLTQVTDVTGTYRKLYVKYTMSGSFWIGLTNQQFKTSDNKGGNPSPVGPVTNQWGAAPFVQVEYSYTGSGYDTIDVTAINELSVPTWLQVRSNNSTPVTLQGPAGATNSAVLPTVLTNLRGISGVNWFGAATNNTALRLVGPSSAAAPGLAMPMGAYLGPGASGTVNFLQGWPGFSAPPMSRYVSQVAYNTTNNVNAPDGNPWGMTKIRCGVGDPNGYYYVWDADLTFVPNTNAQALAPYANPDYVTPVPVLTNVSVGVYTDYGAYTSNPTTPDVTNFPSSLGWSVRYTPDSGNPQNAIFSGYIYSAPASTLNNGAIDQGYVTYYSNGVATNWMATVASHSSSGVFYPSVADFFLNEISFAFAGGFVQSPVYGWTNGFQSVPSSAPWTNVAGWSGIISGNTNQGNPTTLIGRMGSYLWWSQTNGVYRANRTNNDGFYSAWGNQIFNLSPTLYSHPISDRMHYVAYTPGVPLSDAHGSTNVWLEVHFTDSVSAPAPGAARPGIASVSFPNTNLPVGLLYSPSGTGTVITNTNAQGGIIATNLLPFGFVPTDNAAGSSPAFWQNNMILLTNTSQQVPTGTGLTNVPIPEITVAFTNTNSGGVWISALPYGVTATTNGDGSLTFSGQLVPQAFVAQSEFGPVNVVNYSGMGPNGAAPIASIGLMAYGTNSSGELDVTVNELPIFVVGTQPGPSVLGFDPAQGGPGTKVKIWGANFIKEQSSGPALQNFNEVYFSAPSGGASHWVQATYTWPYTNPTTLAVDSNALTATVPQGAATGAILVASNNSGGLTGIGSTQVFTVIPAPNTGTWQNPQGNQMTFVGGFGLGSLLTTNANWASLNMLTVLNWQQSMTDATPGSSGYFSTNLPRGLYIVNRWVTTNAMAGVVSNSWQGYIVGRMIDPLPGESIFSTNLTVTAYGPGGSNNGNITFQIFHTGSFPNSSTNTNAPVPYGVTTFNATNNQVFSNALFYSNTPSYWVASGLPAGLALSVDLNAAGTDVQASIVGTPTGGSGTMTATIKAVNVLRSDAPSSSIPATNTNIITFNFGGGSGFATWGGGVLPAVGTAAYTNALLRYAFGGQAYDGGSTTQTNFGTASLSNISGIDYLVLREIIRTNDPNLNVWSEYNTNLTNLIWTSNSLSPTPSADQTGATAGTQAQDFKTPQGSGERKFLRLKATYQNP